MMSRIAKHHHFHSIAAALMLAAVVLSSPFLAQSGHSQSLVARVTEGSILSHTDAGIPTQNVTRSNSSDVLLSCSPGRVNVASFTSCTVTVIGQSPSGSVTFSAVTVSSGSANSSRPNTSGVFTPSSSMCTLSSGACSVIFTETVPPGLYDQITASYQGDSMNTPSSGGFSLYLTSQSITLATSMSSLSVTGGQAVSDQTSVTGISVNISGSTAPDGTPIAVGTQDLSSLSTGVGAVSLSGAKYYDVVVSGTSSGVAQVCIHDSSSSSATTMTYWSRGGWSSASSVTVNGGIVCGTIPVSALTGTNLAIGNATSFLGLNNTLFYELVGAVVAIIIVAAALVYRRSRKQRTAVQTIQN